MKKDFRRKNGTIKRTQKCVSPRKGVSSIGTRFAQGEEILHLSSSRQTGETFVFTMEDLARLMQAKVGRWHGPTEWGKELQAKWLAQNPQQDA